MTAPRNTAVRQLAAALPKSPRKQRGDPVVGLHAIDEIAGVALAEERDGKAEHVPRKPRRLLQRQPQLDAQQGEPLQRTQGHVQQERDA